MTTPPAEPAATPIGPVRTCVGCRRRAPVGELVRVTVRAEEWVIGPGPGRGAWLCPSGDCLRRALRGRTMARALRRPAVPPPGPLAERILHEPV